jgi:hypothetical protein
VFVTVELAGPLTAELLADTAAATSVGVKVKLVVPVEPSAFFTVIVTVCRPSLKPGDSDQLQVLFVNEPMVPSEAVTEVMASSYSVMLPLAVAVLFSAGLVVWAVTVVVGATSVGVNVKLVVPVEPSAFFTVMVTVCWPSAKGADSDQLQPVFVNDPIVPSEAVTEVMASS